MSPSQKLRIAIIGRGIGGLTLSAALRFLGDEHNFEIHIYEAASNVAEIGAGINFWPRSWDIMEKIGLKDKLLDLLFETPDNLMQTIFECRKSDQHKGVHIQDLNMKGGTVRFHRAELLQVLYGKSMGQIHLSHRFVSYEEHEREVLLQFENGTTAKCDVLIGADGIRSAVRRCFLESKGFKNSPSHKPYWSGAYAYRGLVRLEDLHKEFPGHRVCDQAMLYCGKSKHIIAYRVSHNKLINVVATVSDPSKEDSILDGASSTAVTKLDILSSFAGWEPEVQALLKCIDKPMKYALQAIQPLNRYSTGRVILLGDAAHAMLPHQGAGAGSAVEDAYILACLLTSPLCTSSAIPTIADVYDAIRRPAGNLVMELSKTTGKLCQIASTGFEGVVEGESIPIERLQELCDVIARNWEWCWKESAENDKHRALEMLAMRFSKQRITALRNKSNPSFKEP